MSNVSASNVSASVVVPGVNATVSGGSVSASLSSQQNQISISSGSGVKANVNSGLEVELQQVSDGDVLRYSGSRWRNYNENTLLDGGNW